MQPSAEADGQLADPYSLAVQDMMMFDVPVPFFVIYKLPSDTDDQHMIDSLQLGLEKACERLPPLAAKIILDEMGRPLPRMSPASTPKVNMRKFRLGEYKSYNDLAQRSFAPDDLDLSCLLPAETYHPAKMNERPVCLVQVNFVPGEGVILAIVLNHMVADGSSVSLAITEICKCAKAYMEGSAPSPNNFDYSYDRLPIFPTTEIASKTREQLIIENDRHGICKILKLDASLSQEASWSTLHWQIVQNDSV